MSMMMSIMMIITITMIMIEWTMFMPSNQRPGLTPYPGQNSDLALSNLSRVLVMKYNINQNQKKQSTFLGAKRCLLCNTLFSKIVESLYQLKITLFNML